MPIGLALSNVTNDIFVVDGELATVKDKDLTTQNVKTRLKFVKGEFKLDTAYGFPYVETLGERIFDIVEFETIIKLFILETPGITKLTKFKFDFNRETADRKLVVDFTAETIYGTAATGEFNLTI